MNLPFLIGDQGVAWPEKAWLEKQLGTLENNNNKKNKHHFYSAFKWKWDTTSIGMAKKAGTASIISGLRGRFLLHQVWYKSDRIVAQASLTAVPGHCTSSIRRHGSTSTQNEKQNGISSHTNEDLTVFLPGQQVEHVADVGTLQRKGSNEPVLLMQATNQDALKATPPPKTGFTS